jgi:hypothetical protein
LGWLCGAIICLVLRDISKNFLLPKNIIKEFSLSIYTIFSLLVNFVDNRYSTDWLKSFELSGHVNDGSGYHAASAASSTNTVLCKNCSKKVRKDPSDYVQMQFSAQLQNWKCPRCDGTKQLKVRALSPKYIRDRQEKVMQKRDDMFYYQPIFHNVKRMYKYIINKNKEDILKRFEEYEILASKDLLLKKEGYFMVHYDSSKKWKKRSCYIPWYQLALVHSNDNQYSSEYKPLINDLARRLHYNEELIDTQDDLLQHILNELERIGWPRRHLKEKIKADINYLKFSSF